MNINEILAIIYNKKKIKGYFSEYGTDVFITIGIICLFLIPIIYYYFLNHIPKIKQNWAKNKCNPAYLPFAGMISDDKNKSNFDLISRNFEDCTKNILTSITNDALAPLNYSSQVFTQTAQDITKALEAGLAMVNKIRVDVQNISQDINAKILNVLINLIKIIIYAKGIGNKLTAVLKVILLVVFVVLFSIESLLINIIEFIIEIILTPLGLTIVILFATFQIVGGTLSTALFIAILIPLTILINIFNTSFHKNVSPPAVPACFGKYTHIKLSDNTAKYIYEININDKLHDGSIVTGIMQMSSYGHSTFDLNGIIVTGLHRVYHNELGWIKVADHPDSHKIKDYRENILYCLNTDTKVIKINNFTFLDWDDLDDNDIKQININCKAIPKYLNNKDIHKYLDNGFDEDTLIQLEIGTQTKIKNIEVNDILKFGEKVLGIIKIDSNDILVINKYHIGNCDIKCSSNIQLQVDNSNIINTSNLEGIPIITNKYLYQLITDKGYFYIENIKVYDYNVGIEKYLDNTEFYS